MEIQRSKQQNESANKIFFELKNNFLNMTTKNYFNFGLNKIYFLHSINKSYLNKIFNEF